MVGPKLNSGVSAEPGPTPAQVPCSGLLAVTVCPFVAAVYLTYEAVKIGDSRMLEYSRRRAFIASSAAGVMSVIGILVFRVDDPYLYDRSHISRIAVGGHRNSGRSDIVVPSRSNIAPRGQVDGGSGSCIACACMGCGPMGLRATRGPGHC